MPQATFSKLISSALELKNSQLASDYQLGAYLHHGDAECLVMECLPAKTPLPVHNAAFIQRYCQQLNKLHQITPSTLSIAPSTYQRICYYLSKQNLEDGFTILLGKAQKIQNRLEALCHKKVWIHNDLHSDNIIDTGKHVYFIDWESSGLGDPFVDLAEIALYLDEQAQYNLLKTYRNSPLEANDWERLQLARYLRILMCASWALKHTHPHTPMTPKRHYPLAFHQVMEALLHQTMTLSSAKNYQNFAEQALHEFTQLTSV